MPQIKISFIIILTCQDTFLSLSPNVISSRFLMLTVFKLVWINSSCHYISLSTALIGQPL